MRNLIIAIVIFIVIGFLSVQFIGTSENDEIVVGMIVPMEHIAMTEIISGFKSNIKTIKGQKVKVLVKNAQGDLNLQKSIIQQYINKNIDYFVPIGLCATEMTVKLVKDKPVIFLAADITKKSKDSLITGVIDEIGNKNLDFIKEVYPNINKISLVFASAQKVYNEAQEIEKYCKNNNIKLQKLMIKDLSDMYALSKTIDDDSNVILILKDHLVVSSTPLLAKIATEKKLPLITSDDGSIKNGGAFALGVQEKSIGVIGAKLLSEILAGKNINDLPIKNINELVVFYNKKAIKEQNVNLENIKNAAKKMNYKLEEVNIEEKVNNEKKSSNGG